jgi:hypothetical protein
MWNRSQMALAIIAASMVFHQLAHVSDPWWILVPAALAATIAAYAINAILVALHASLQHGLTVRQVLRKMHGSRPAEFLASYIGLALFGVVIARFLWRKAWSVVFLAPLVFARQMYFQSRMMADRLAEQNELLTAQATDWSIAAQGGATVDPPRAEPHEGRVRRGRLPRAPHADHGDDRLREDAPASRSSPTTTSCAKSSPAGWSGRATVSSAWSRTC